VVEGVHKDGADANLFGDSYAAGNGVAQQVLSQPAALVFAVDRKACQQDHRYRVGHVPAKLARQVGVRHRSRRKSVVTDNSPIPARDEATRCATGVVRQRTRAEVIVQGGCPTVERRERARRWRTP
jgi:hypothetical protein